MKKLLCLLVLFSLSSALIGCEASTKADSDGVKAEIKPK